VLRPLRILARWKLIRLAAAGENWLPIQSAPGLFTAPDMKLLESLDTCGVVSIGSSMSLSIGSSSEDVVLLVSESSMLMLLTELDAIVLSECGIVDHIELVILLGESNTLLLPRLLLGGICKPRPEIVGEESGDDSASVEW
jgi:hypothetical protein